jgi:hypothetical protein
MFAHAETNTMQRAVTVQQIVLVVGGLVAAVFLFGAGRFSSQPSEDRGSKGEIPVTVQDVNRAGGFAGLSKRQQEWVRKKYLHDLEGLRTHVDRRRQSYAARGLTTHVQETEAALALLEQAIAQAQTGDPTTTQPLIDEVNQALRR